MPDLRVRLDFGASVSYLLFIREPAGNRGMLYISLYYYITSRVTLIHVSTPSFFLIRSVFSLSPASHVVTSIFIPTYTYKGVYSKKGEGVNTNTNTTCTTRTRTNLWTVIPRIHSPTTPTMMLAVSQHRSICSTFV